MNKNIDRCKGVKRNGESCTLPARGSDGFCWAHSPENAKQRRENASKAGKVKTGGEITIIKARLKAISEEVLEGKTTTAKGSVFATLYGVLIRAIEQERKQKLEELEERLEALESIQPQGGHRWGR